MEEILFPLTKTNPWPRAINKSKCKASVGKSRGPTAAAWLLLEPLGAAGMGTSAGAALYIHGVHWDPQDSHTKLSTAVTAAVGYLCLPIRCLLPQNIWERQRPNNIPAAAMKLYLLISAFTDFLVVQIQGTLQLAKPQPAMLGSICPHHCHNPPRLQQKVANLFQGLQL